MTNSFQIYTFCWLGYQLEPIRVMRMVFLWRKVFSWE